MKEVVGSDKISYTWRMTIAELSRIDLFCIVASGAMVGTYGPLLFIHIYRDDWHGWRWQTKAYFIFATCVAFALIFSPIFLAPENG